MNRTKSSVQSFDSPEEADQALFDHLRSLTPQQRAENFCKLLMSIHGDAITTRRRIPGHAEIIDFPMN